MAQKGGYGADWIQHLNWTDVIRHHRKESPILFPKYVREVLLRRAGASTMLQLLSRGVHASPQVQSRRTQRDLSQVRCSSRLLPGDDGRHLFPLVPLAPREFEQLINARQQRAPLGRAYDANTPTAREVEEPFVAQDVERPYHRVLVDAEYRREVDGSGHPLSWSRLTISDGPPKLGSHYVVEGDRVVLAHSSHSHGTIHIVLDPESLHDFDADRSGDSGNRT